MSGWACVWLGLLSLPAHALSLGNLTVSSNASPSFTASLPFSDDKPVRLPELQTRLATDAEYAQWGMQMVPAVRELRVRVVPASQTVGYVELFSPTNLSQDNFDLLVWASYAGQTMLTHYKVTVLDVPSLIKGKTLSIAVSSASPRQGKDLAPKAGLEKPPKTPLPADAPAPALTVEPSTTKQIEANPGNGSETAPPTVAAPAASQPPVAEAVTPAHQALPADASVGSIFGSGMAIGVFSLMLFLFGFWMGRLRSRSPTVTPPMRPHPAVATAALDLGKPSSKSSAMDTRETPPAPTMPSSSTPLAPAFRAQPLREPLQMSPLPSAFNLSQAALPEAQVASTPNSEAPPSVQAAPLTPPATSTAPDLHSLSGLSPTSTFKPEATAAQASEGPTAAARLESWAEPSEPLSATVMPSQPVRLHAEPVASGESADWVPAPSTSTSMMAPLTVVARTPATALPTPGLVSVSARSKKKGKTKSLGDSNIDLAKIYMSMGDPTTAQLLLQQVMEQGTAAEKVQAEQLMQEMV